MNENKHTSGPWSISRKSDHSHRAWIGAPGWGKFARVVVRMNGSIRDSQEGLANARLIAAAPEMLEALRKAHQFIRNGIEYGYIRMPDASTPDSAHDTPPMIAAAIAKAEGRFDQPIWSNIFPL